LKDGEGEPGPRFSWFLWVSVFVMSLHFCQFGVVGRFDGHSANARHKLGQRRFGGRRRLPQDVFDGPIFAQSLKPLTHDRLSMHKNVPNQPQKQTLRSR
jgi:hypothetical protein